MSDTPKSDLITIVNEVSTRGDWDKLNAIDPIIISYQVVIKKLLLVPVPTPLLDEHLKLVNSLSSMLYVAQGLRAIQTDPMQALVAVSAYEDARTGVIVSLEDIGAELLKSGISLADTEPGALFTMDLQ